LMTVKFQCHFMTQRGKSGYRRRGFKWRMVFIAFKR
jgi:hypothetical protein